jgi:CBS domain-containing protein
VTDPTPSAPESNVTTRVGQHMSRAVRSIAQGATLHDAARLLAEHGISCLVVVDGDQPVGILSERDLVRHVAHDPTGWAARPVQESMTHPLHVTDTGATVAHAIEELRRHHIRRLPVITAEGRLAGIVTQTDLLRAAHRRLEDYAANLERLVSERTAELRQIELRRDDLVDLTVHDIKNSICVVDSALQLLDEETPGFSSMAPLLRRATQRIRNLVTTLLTSTGSRTARCRCGCRTSRGRSSAIRCWPRPRSWRAPRRSPSAARATVWRSCAAIRSWSSGCC